MPFPATSADLTTPGGFRQTRSASPQYETDRDGSVLSAPGQFTAFRRRLHRAGARASITIHLPGVVALPSHCSRFPCHIFLVRLTDTWKRRKAAPGIPGSLPYQPARACTGRRGLALPHYCGPNVMISVGGVSPFSRLWNCCSTPGPPSTASRIRNP